MEFGPFYYPEPGGGADPKEPDEESHEDSTHILRRIDDDLREAGHLSDAQGQGAISGREIRHRIRDEVQRRREKSLESTPEQRAEIKEFLTILKIPGAESISDQELEIIWVNILRNPALVKDFVFILANNTTKKYYSEFPILPDAKDLVEWSDALENPESLRPKIIRDGADNLEKLGFSRKKIMETEMGSQGPEAAEKMQMMGWLAGFPFMQGEGVKNEILEHHKVLGLEEITDQSLGQAFTVIVEKALSVVKGREKEYSLSKKTDRKALEVHAEVRRSLEGISALLDKTFNLIPPEK
jgi:hypothetical protein